MVEGWFPQQLLDVAAGASECGDVDVKRIRLDTVSTSLAADDVTVAAAAGFGYVTQQHDASVSQTQCTFHYVRVEAMQHLSHCDYGKCIIKPCSDHVD